MLGLLVAVLLSITGLFLMFLLRADPCGSSGLPPPSFVALIVANAPALSGSDQLGVGARSRAFSTGYLIVIVLTRSVSCALCVGELALGQIFEGSRCHVDLSAWYAGSGLFAIAVCLVASHGARASPSPVSRSSPAPVRTTDVDEVSFLLGRVPGSARFCPACGAPVGSVSQLPTGLATPSVAEAALRRGASDSPVGRLASSPSLDGGGFSPGTILGERYRIIGLVGRGGMGEVYRADDLKLGQPVALKFLPQKLASEPACIERFYAEVRHARGVSHPNVCRVYDVGEIEGRHFLSMEYVDGEDLASLLRRIGRLPPDKAIEIARELCAGLAAAHDKGVLHRDLKPGNVMIDGRGRAKITDFGLAVGVDDDKGGAEVSGTPAYMAPEQLAGKGASVQSDIYALGLVLYELFTGRKAFEAATLAEWRRKHAEEQPTSPSTVTPGFDPVVERVILRCLEKDPKARPRSVAAVAAALPGGDPLAAAIAAGETPSPEMVAAAGSDEGMKPAAAWACLVLILAGMALAAYLSPRAYRHGHVPLEKPPEALAERSKEIIRRLGYTEKPLGTAWGFSGNGEYRRWVEEHDKSKDRWKDMEDGRPAAIYFWYRQSPGPLVPERFRGEDSGGGHSDRERSAADDERHGRRRARPAGPPDPFRGGPVLRAAGVVRRARLVDSSRRSRARRRGLLAGRAAVASSLVRGCPDGVGRKQTRTTGPAAARRSGGRSTDGPSSSSSPDPGAVRPGRLVRPS